MLNQLNNFTPSIEEQILKVENTLEDQHKIIVSSMGSLKEEDDMTVHILNFDKNFEQKYEKIYIGERIRDIIDLNNGTIIMTLESLGNWYIKKFILDLFY